MSNKRVVSPIFFIVLLAFLAAGCGSEQSDPTPTAAEAAMVPTSSQTASPTVAPEGTATAEPGPSIAGRYRLRPLAYEPETEEVEEDIYLVLNEDNTALYEVQEAGESTVSVIARGTWQIDGDGALIEITELFGETVTNPEILKYEYIDGFPEVSEYQADGQLFDVAQAAYSIGSGERHPLIRELHHRLARIEYLDFEFPEAEADLYTEDTRLAVVAFQEAQGLLPDGVVDADTWVLLGNPPPPLPTPTPVPLPESAQPIATTTEILNVRSGSGTQFEVVGTLSQGASLAITGRNADSTWLQVPYPDINSRAWISAQFVTVSGNLSVVNLVQDATQPDEVTPDSGTAPPPAENPPTDEAAPPAATELPRVGTPNLENLPTHTEDGKPIVYLTFDDGPAAPYTQQILDLLDQYDAKATFFAVGRQVDTYPELVRAAASAGHYIANHTFSHHSLANVVPEQFLDEVEGTRNAILETAGDLFTLDRDVRYLRPPYGATDANTRNYAASLGYAVTLWDVDPQDWRRPGGDVVASHIISSVRPGDIVLMHDGGGDRSQSVAALERVLRELSAQGYAFRNVFIAR